MDNRRRKKIRNLQIQQFCSFSVLKSKPRVRSNSPFLFKE